MAIKDILFPIIGYPEPTPPGNAGLAADLAAALGAGLTALRVETEFAVPANVLANKLLDLPGMVAETRTRSAAVVQERMAELRAVTGSMPDAATLSCPEPCMGDALVAQARVHDLTLLPIASPGGPLAYVAEQVVFGSGRPVLLLPGRGRTAPDIAGAPVVVAWDDSRPAARAVADALPLLETASVVHVVTVLEEDPSGRHVAHAGLLRNLARHGIRAGHGTIPRKGRPVGRALAEAAAERGAGLLVMGAYGHSRMRDFILGGATRDLLRDPPLPILLSH